MELYNIPLITAQDVRDLTPEIPDTINDDMFSGFIIKEGDTYLQGFLGKEMYQEFLLQYSTNTLTVTNDYLYKRYIKTILVNRVTIKLFDSITFQPENSGVRVKITDQSREVTLDELTRKIQIYQNYCDNYSQDMVRYINENITNYPLFYKSTYCYCKDKINYQFGRFGMQAF
jgi:hypothetical protein